MTEAVVKEYVRCAHCKRPVVKQKFCPRCGNILIKEEEGPPQGDEKNMSDKSFEKPVETVEANPIEESSETTVKKDPVTIEDKSVYGIVPASDEGKDRVTMPFEDMIKTFPDVTKNVRNMSNLVNLLKEEEITEDAFLGLYNGMAEDAQKLVQRRGELVAEIKAAVKGYRSKMISVKHDMKLLNIRARATALKRDINEYKSSLREEEEAAHSENLERLNDSAELEELMIAVNNCADALSELHVSEDVRNKIQSSMQGTLSLLKETNGSQ
jgi:hypothetical protein